MLPKTKPITAQIASVRTTKNGETSESGFLVLPHDLQRKPTGHSTRHLLQIIPAQSMQVIRESPQECLPTTIAPDFHRLSQASIFSQDGKPV
jgi:hypothetical protein